MVFEPITFLDLDEIRSLRPEGWSDIVTDYEFYINSTYCIPVKTKLNGVIVGIGSLIFFDKSSWIGHVIVAKNYGGRGIGYQTVVELLNILKENSIETCSLIASEEGRPIYIKAGFRDVTEYVFMYREKTWQNTSINPN